MLAIVLAAGAGLVKAILAGLSAAGGLALAAATWIRLGRPSTDGMFKRHPGVALLLVVIFVVGLIPTVVWAT